MKHASTIRITLFSCLFLFLFTNCKKTVIETSSYPDFIGVWYAVAGTQAGIEFDIQDGSATWLKYEGITTTNLNGTPKISPKRDKLKLTPLKKFDIDSYPALVDGTWTMVLDGITYEKD